MSALHPLEILKQYWGYAEFRPLQEDIVNSVLAGKDTLALLPTGGGKSVCFQVPALALEGICLVISPLIALMKDQVQQLRQRGISAQGLYSGMSFREMDIALDNCIFGNTKFLYLSPERLKTALFQERLTRMKIGLLAVDEAHCISQWGYDFRPPYLQIADIREFLPQVPVIALTATATPAVREDIMDKLLFKGRTLFVKSFARANLSYSALCEEDTRGRILKMLNKIAGTAIVYVRSRKETEALATWLERSGVSASAYHAGLSPKDRDERQARWIQDKIRVMVATNAFGMGIDKSNVRLVIHIGLPESLEAYYQEAGRAGRDEKKAFAVLLWTKNDLSDLAEKVEKAHPPSALIRQVYGHLSSYFQLAVGSGEQATFPFKMDDFAKRFKYKAAEVYVAIKKLEESGHIQWIEPQGVKSRVTMLLDATKLYEYQVKYEEAGMFIRFMMRLYGGEMFSGMVYIDEDDMALKYKQSRKAISDRLMQLHQEGVLEYHPVNELPMILYLTGRYLPEELPLNEKYLKARKSEHKAKAQAVIDYTRNDQRCRTLALLYYFGEDSDQACGVCDICVHRQRQLQESLKLRQAILDIVTKQAPLHPRLLFTHKELPSGEKTESVLRQLMDEGVLALNQAGQLVLSRNDR